MNTQKDPNAKEGMRIKLITMVDDPNPIPTGMEGTIILIDDMGIIHVNWDNGRRLGVVPGTDEYILEPALENVFDKLGENEIKKALKTKPKTSSSEIKLGKMTSSSKSSKTFKSANIKEDEIDETTGAGGAATGAASSSGAYLGPVGATGPTYGTGPLTSTGVAKPGPLHPEKKTKEKKKKQKKDYMTIGENIFTKAELIEEITNSKDSGYYDDTRFEAWTDINNDGWRWNDKPAFHEEGEIIDPLTKIKSTWDDSNMDISKEWDNYQNRLKKEDVLRMVSNRLDEKWSKKYKESIDCNNPKGFSQKAHCQGKKKHVKEEEQIGEETTFGSVFPGGNYPSTPFFAAQKGQWRTAKKPIWKGGKIVQKVENSGVLNPVNEANTVKYHPQGKIVKIKKKCTKFPYCSQGAVDNPLNISDKVTEPGSYVEEQLMKNIHEVAKMTGKSFDEVYNIVKNEIFI